MLINQRFLPVLACAVCLSLIVGCGRPSGPRRVAVRGAILFDDRPLKAGRIKFTPIETSKGPTSVATVTDGFYDFDARNGPVVGKHKVQIESIVEPGFELDDEGAYAQRAKQQTGAPVLPPQPIPPEFNERTTLTVNVSPEGETKLDFTVPRATMEKGRGT